MQRLSTSFQNLPIFSLRTAHPVGTALTPIINPNTLKIEAWFAESRFESGELVLPSSEIREIGKQGIAVNDQDSITPLEDLVRLAPLAELNFQLIGKRVITEDKVRLGKVEDYATDTASLFIQKLYIRPTSFGSFTKKPTIISRTQIVEINKKFIVVKDATVPIKSFFRAPVPAPEA